MIPGYGHQSDRVHCGASVERDQRKGAAGRQLLLLYVTWNAQPLSLSTQLCQRAIHRKMEIKSNILRNKSKFNITRPWPAFGRQGLGEILLFFNKKREIQR